MSLAEFVSVFEFSKAPAAVRRAFTKAVIRFALSPVMRVSVRNCAELVP
jgi:hypothetical protein